jgi:hypothetical protein
MRAWHDNRQAVLHSFGQCGNPYRYFWKHLPQPPSDSGCACLRGGGIRACRGRCPGGGNCFASPLNADSLAYRNGGTHADVGNYVNSNSSANYDCDVCADAKAANN